MKLQLAFQGGGARLVPLVAAAHAAQDLSIAKGFEITRVAGTSAGAIPAAALALGEPLKAFQERLIRHAETYFGKIVSDISFAGLILNVPRGKPLYDPTAYLEFLDKVFGEAPGASIAGKPPALNLYSSNIRSGSLMRTSYSSNSIRQRSATQMESDFVQSIFNSSAIPFIFRTHKTGGELVDGGLLRNFPTNDLLEAAEDDGQVLGFTFKPSMNNLDGGLVSFLKALAGTVVDYGVKVSTELMPPDNVHQIATDIGMLDFRRALAEMKSSAYQNYYQGAASFIEKFLDLQSVKQKHQVSVVNANAKDQGNDWTNSFVEGVIKLHSELKSRGGLRVRKRVFRYTCRTLGKGLYDVEDHDDELKITDEVFAKEPLSTYGCRLLSGGKPYHPREVSVAVYKTAEKSRRIDATTLTLPPQHLESIKSDCSNVMVFLHQPVISQADEAEDSWTISYSCGAQEPMSYLAKEKLDWVGHFNASDTEVEELVIICDVPSKYSDVHLSDIRAGKRPDRYTQWISGRALTKEELEQYDLAPPGFVRVGWLAKNVPPGGSAGFEGSVT